MSQESDSTVSTTSLVFERIEERVAKESKLPYNDKEDDDDDDPLKDEEHTDDLETGPFLGGNANGSSSSPSARDGAIPPIGGAKRMDRGLRKTLLIVAAALIAAWVIGLFVYISSKSYKHASSFEHDPQATVTRGSGKQVTLDQVMQGYWFPESHSISWIEGAEGEDGLLLEKGAAGKDYLVVEDVRTKNPGATATSPGASQVLGSTTLMKEEMFDYAGKSWFPSRATPSRDLKKVLVATNVKSNWRHSSYAVYWIFDVATQTVDPLIPGELEALVQFAQWSPTSDSIVFTRNNNLFIRRVGDQKVTQITTDGGPEVFNGVPDWVYEEEVLGGASATWLSEDGKYIAFLRTNETGVPEYPIQYFVSRPSGAQPKPGEEAYPEERFIKYPKAGAHNPVVDLKFYDVVKGDVFSVDISGRFADDDRLITTVVWAGDHVLIKETNRVSDILRVVLVDVAARTGKAVRTVDVGAIDGGWFEISQKTSPIMLTSGPWEVVDAPSAIDLDQNIVYFVGTKESSIQRHVYQVKLTGKDMAPVSDTTAEGYYGISFSTGAGYALLSYRGPGIPWQKIISTPTNPISYEHVVEENPGLADAAKKHELPIKIYGTVNIDGVDLNYIERRPPHFDDKKTYPVLFQQYSGPGSQTVSKRFDVDFQSYVAAGLGYVCVTVDGRGTGYIGRKNRVLVRGKLGQWESHDQIAAAKLWAKKKYVDASRLAIWGWSFGGFMALKTLEQDAGRTFSYGMAVAPVTDWRFYDSIYTERYMLTPQTNSEGYDGAAINNVTALQSNVRFLLMHGIADDNVHMQSTVTLLDKLDLAGVENYDVHVFPDSDHGIYFHNANRVVYDKLTNWLVNAFNGEWLKIASPVPNESRPGGAATERERRN
ncbi:dipeptidyl peptidase IV N-terminal region-domain-containing protein [Bombardia bombarda]|uniref:Probable dipeptidyl-aminopeptidase B n=1 Tax=Bombardia bombarda TaxID=252184 RepID=A0AA39X0P8_9PEZI|nr:dipeptidyl peptidase IV N-terminal region-domain-containing protein [Bombardia bombarda]